MGGGREEPITPYPGKEIQRMGGGREEPITPYPDQEISLQKKEEKELVVIKTMCGKHCVKGTQKKEEKELL